MAARETGFGAVETYMHQGKLLALDLLVRVLTNPMHDWSHMRLEFAGGAEQPGGRGSSKAGGAGRRAGLCKGIGHAHAAVGARESGGAQIMA